MEKVMSIERALKTLFKKDVMAVRSIICQYEEDYDVVDELTQDTFLKAWENRGSFNDKSKLLTWVCQIAKNVSRDYIKGKRGTPHLVPEDVLKCADSDSYTDTLVAANPQDDPAEAWLAEDMLDKALALMTPQQAAAVKLRTEGYCNADIAEMLGTTEAVVRTQISTSRRYF